MVHGSQTECLFQWTGRRISGIDGRVRLDMAWRGGALLEAEPVSCGVQDPGVVVGALHAGVQAQRLPGQLPRGQGAGVGQRAEGLTLKSMEEECQCACFSDWCDLP